jgi:mannose-1-phosphate guanylyltransferase
MKGLILVGGFGTRLRPLTFTKPKPMVEFANKPIVLHQIEALAKVGCSEVILAVNYKPEVMMAGLKAIEEEYGIKVTCSQETEPLGTAGPLALAREKLGGDGEPFFVFNSDVTCEYPLQGMLDFHRAHGAEGTICVTQVEEPSKYGVVVHNEAGAIQHFVEKPQTFVGNHINAGLYLFNPSILDRISPKPTSIEKEIFPVMANEDQLYAMVLPGYWMDIGQPKDYLTGMRLHLNSVAQHEPERLARGDHITGNVLVHPTATIEAGAVLGPDVVIGPGVSVGAGSKIVGTTILAGASIGSHCCITKTIVGWDSRIGSWVHTDGVCVLGEDVAVSNGVVMNGAIVLPHKGIKDSLYEPKIVM